MFAFLLILLALAVIVGVVGISSLLWMTSQDLEVKRIKEPSAIVRKIETPIAPTDLIPDKPALTPERPAKPLQTRTLTNRDGRKQTFELISKTDTHVKVRTGGKIYDIAIRDLSDADQVYIRKEWKP